MKVTIPMLSGKTYTAILQEANPLVQEYRKPHDKEISNYDNNNALVGYRYMGDGYRSGPVRGAVINSPENPEKKGMPEVYRIWPDHPTLIPCNWLWFWRYLNPELTESRFCTLLDNRLAWTNGTGFPGRKNCIMGNNMDEKDPAFHAPIINGGALLRGVELNGWLEIEGLLTSQTPPDPDDVIANKPWLWFWGTTVLKDGQINYITRLGADGIYYPVRVPILSRLPLRIKLEHLHKLPLGVRLEPTVMS